MFFETRSVTYENVTLLHEYYTHKVPVILYKNFSVNFTKLYCPPTSIT